VLRFKRTIKNVDFADYFYVRTFVFCSLAVMLLYYINLDSAVILSWYFIGQLSVSAGFPRLVALLMS